MHINLFQLLDSDEQLFIAQKNGIIVAEREDSYAYRKLYQLHSFYVEICYTKHDNELWKFVAFDHPIMLQPYLDKIDLGNLLNNDQG